MKSGSNQSHEKNQTLWTLLATISGVTDEFERARLIAAALPALVHCDLGAVALMDEVGSTWRLVLHQDGRVLGADRTEQLRAELEPLSQEVVRSSILQRFPEEGAVSSGGLPPVLEALGIRQLAIAPLATQSAGCIGFLLVGSESSTSFSSQEEEILKGLAEQSANSIENLRRHHRLARESKRIERQNDLILQSAGEGIYGLDTAGLTTFVNPAATQMLGWTTEEIIGEPMHALLHHSRPDGSRYPREECPIYAAFKDGQVHAVDDELFWRKDGSSFPVEYTSTPIREGDRLVGAVVVFRNLIQRKLAEKNLRQALSEVEELKNRLQAENVYLQEEIRRQHNFEEIIGESAAIRTVLDAIEAVASTNANVVITGETGTGKELVARALHKLSLRQGKALIKVNCASIPRDLFESEFFGHVKGAFTGAVQNRAGRFELADGGSIFLDEVGEIPLDMQSKFLRVLQEGQFERIGDAKTRRVDVRVIAATNRDLKKEVAAGRFREDLYYRLNVFPIEVPPLRNRIGDIPLLAAPFLERAAKEMNRGDLMFTEGNIAQLQAYNWPGNVRELRNVIERAVITSKAGRLRLDLPIDGLAGAVSEASSQALLAKVGSAVIPESEIRRLERDNLLAALERTDWTVYGAEGAAELLGIKPSTLASRIKKMGLQRPEASAADPSGNSPEGSLQSAQGTRDGS